MAKKRIAVFDIDGTIFRSSLLRELLESLITFGIFPYRAQE
ncbi:MAG: HAD-IB family hydrolase, partial [Candidatus Sungbacteria bacterium]|nr:HAD-IB family hydrolase [Candidatus Sungbacteria bacterium]